jgi:hypothetical protein
MQTPPSGTSDHRPPPAPADQQLSERPGIQPDFYDVRQYSRPGVLAVWAAAALPMAALAWLVAPAVRERRLRAPVRAYPAGCADAA